MIRINSRTTLKTLAQVVGKILAEAGINAVLTGGAVVSIYTDNKYQSYDLDFVTYSSCTELEKALEDAGFYREGRLFRHPDTAFFLDFPAPPLSVGQRPVTVFNELKSDEGYLKLLTPTHCVMDRLAAFYHWNDPQSLTQALLVVRSQPVDLGEIRKWSIEEGMEDKYILFVRQLNM